MRALSLVLVALVASAQAVVQTCSISPCSPRAVTADFTFIVDVSSSLGSASNFILLQNFLSNFTSGLTFSPEDSQVAIYTYSLQAKTYLSLTQGSDAATVQHAIQNITFDNTHDRQIYQALNKEETEVTANSGFRAGYKHVMVVISGDSWTGTSIIGSSLLAKVQRKYDLVMAIGLGANAVKNQQSALQQLTTVQSNIFYSLNYDQLPYAGQWLYNYACPGTHMSTSAPPTTVMPTQSPSVPCQLSTLNYDVYLVVDTSNAISAADFATLKQSLLDFVKPFPVGDGKTQFSLIATSIDSEMYYTGFHQGQNRATVLDTIQTLTQDGSNGQTLQLSLQAIQSAYLKQNYPTANKVVVYFTGTTNFDTDPDTLMRSMSTQYGVKALAVQWTTTASSSLLNMFTGGAGCTYTATTASTRSQTAAWLQTKMCNKVYCL